MWVNRLFCCKIDYSFITLSYMPVFNHLICTQKFPFFHLGSRQERTISFILLGLKITLVLSAPSYVCECEENSIFLSVKKIDNNTEMSRLCLYTFILLCHYTGSICCIILSSYQFSRAMQHCFFLLFLLRINIIFLHHLRRFRLDSRFSFLSFRSTSSIFLLRNKVEFCALIHPHLVYIVSLSIWGFNDDNDDDGSFNKQNPKWNDIPLRERRDVTRWMRAWSKKFRLILI